MDPNATLKRIRTALVDFDDGDSASDCFEEIASAFADLDNYLKQGGFPPDEWFPNESWGWIQQVLKARIENTLETSESLCMDSDSDRAELCNKLVKAILP